MTTILGIDPGLTGSLAWLNTDGRLLEVRDMPLLNGRVSPWHLLDDDEISAERVMWAVLEEPKPIPNRRPGGGTGPKAAYSMGHTLGVLHTVLLARKIPVHLVAPSIWKRQLGLTSDKDLSRALAVRTWPDKADLFRRVKDGDRAEAALIAWYWLTKKVAGTQMKVV